MTLLRRQYSQFSCHVFFFNSDVNVGFNIFTTSYDFIAFMQLLHCYYMRMLLNFILSLSSSSSLIDRFYWGCINGCKGMVYFIFVFPVLNYSGISLGRPPLISDHQTIPRTNFLYNIIISLGQPPPYFRPLSFALGVVAQDRFICT